MSERGNEAYGAGGGQPYQTSITLGGSDGAAVAPAATPADLIKDTTTATFTADVIQASKQQPVLVDFWAPWCGPCKQLTPVLEKAVLAARGAVRLVKMNIDDHPSIAGQLGIQSIPAVIAFKDGQPVDGFMGAVPETQINAFIDRLSKGAGPKTADLLAEAQGAITAGDTGLAAEIYAAILQADADNVDALAGLAGLYYDSGETEMARQMLDQVPPAKAEHQAVVGLRAKMALADQAGSLGDGAELERRIAADPADHEARFDLALLLNSKGDRTAAADQLLEIMKADREWREDGARTQLLQFFEAWGMTDPATNAARRKLSSLLFR